MSQETNPGAFQYIDKAQFVRMNGTFEIFPAVARIFSDLLPSWLEDFQRGLETQDLEELADKLHKMKGCCGMMGAYVLSQEIAVLEKHVLQSGLLENMSTLSEVVRKIKEMDTEVSRLAKS